MNIGYVKFERAGYNWAQADAACKAAGMELVTFDDAAEYDLVQHWLGETTGGRREFEPYHLKNLDAFWTGYRDDHGVVEPAGYTRFLEGEPNNKMGNEACIR